MEGAMPREPLELTERVDDDPPKRPSYERPTAILMSLIFLALFAGLSYTEPGGRAILVPMAFVFVGITLMAFGMRALGIGVMLVSLAATFLVPLYVLASS
jgi:hypothetical protein